MLKKQDDKYIVTSKSGKKLSKPKSKKEALKQLAAIEANKKKK